MKNLVLYMLCAMLLVSCRNKVVYSINPHLRSSENSSLVKSGEMTLDLDSMTTPDVISLNYLDQGKTKSLYFYNNFTRDVYIYDGETGKFKDKVHLQKEGPDRVGKVTGIYAHSEDSLFVLDPWHGQMSLVDHTGKKIDSVPLLRYESKKLNAPFPSLSTENPMLFRDGKLFLTGSSLGEVPGVERPMGICYKWHSDTPTYFMPFPAIYNEANWAGSSFRAIYTCFNQQNHMIFSFPADHNIYEASSQNGPLVSHYAGSKYFDTIASFSEQDEIKNRFVVNKYFATTPSYSSLIYDKYRDCYYRIADLPIKSYAQGFKERSVKPFSIIILDNKFNVVGETAIPHLSHSRICFVVTEKGLLLRKYDNNDEHLVFSIFSLVKNSSNVKL